MQKVRTECSRNESATPADFPHFPDNHAQNTESFHPPDGVVGW